MIAETMLVLVIAGKPIKMPMDGETACQKALYSATTEEKTATSGYCITKHGRIILPEHLH